MAEIWREEIRECHRAWSPARGEGPAAPLAGRPLQAAAKGSVCPSPQPHTARAAPAADLHKILPKHKQTKRCMKEL